LVGNTQQLGQFAIKRSILKKYIELRLSDAIFTVML